MLKPNPRRFFRFTCNGKYSEKDLDRCSSHIDTTPGLGPRGDCWEWKGCTDKYGYGATYIRRNGKSINIKAHRMAYEMATGILIPDGKCVLHHCDNPRCVKSYAHLYIGTNQDNANDRENRGRSNPARGEDHCCAIFTWEIVNNIRKLLLIGKETHIQLGEQFRTCAQNIDNIASNKSWYDPNYTPPIYENDGNPKINREYADRIRIEYSTGKYTYKQLADKFNIGKTNIGYIIQNKRWYDPNYNYGGCG